MTICYFTATGNSLYVAKRIGGNLLSIPHLMKNNQLDIKDDAVGIVCPTYAGQMPLMVKEFMERARIKANYLFVVYTFGMSETVVRPNAITVLQKSGKKLDYVDTIKMVDNYLPGFEMKNQMETAGEKKIEEQIDKVCKNIQNRIKNAGKPGVGDRIGMAVIRNTMGRVIFKRTAAQGYIVNDDCIGCGICAKVCPADNITVKQKPRFSNKCEVCFACLHNCPKNAIHLKNEKSGVRFRNENVSVKEIIEANEK